MTFKDFTRVRLLTDTYAHEGVTSGAIGYIIEIYNDDAFEVEFSDKQGITIAQIVVHHNEIEATEHPDSAAT